MGGAEGVFEDFVCLEFGPRRRFWWFDPPEVACLRGGYRDVAMVSAGTLLLGFRFVFVLPKSYLSSRPGSLCFVYLVCVLLLLRPCTRNLFLPWDRFQ